MRLTSPTVENRLSTALVVSIGVCCLVLAFRNFGLYPLVFSDEYTYSVLSRLTPLNQAFLPDFLYLWVYRFTNACGDGFLACAKTLNLLFFFGALPFVYLVAGRLTTRPMAFAICLLAAAAPANTYTALFMPESFYFFGFWLMSWAALQLDSDSSPRRWIMVGAVFGAVALVKPHSLLLAPSLLAYFALLFRGDRTPVRDAVVKLALFLVVAIAVKFVGGWLFAGRAGLTLFGTAYSSIARDAASTPDQYARFLQAALFSLGGNAAGLLLLFAVPLASLCMAMAQVRHGPLQFRTRVACYASTTLAVLLPVTALVTASVAGLGPYESAGRIHMRYYSFCFPLLLMLAASTPPDRDRTVLRTVVAIAGAVGLCAAIGVLPLYSSTFVDSPELRGVTANATLLRVIFMASLLMLVYWWFAAARAGFWFIVALGPLIVGTCAYVVDGDMELRSRADAYDVAGLFAKRFLSPADAAGVVVVGSSPVGHYQTLFALDNRFATTMTLAEGVPLDRKAIAGDRTWALVMGDHPVSDDLYQLKLNGFTLARLSSVAASVDFSRSSWPGIVSAAHGLSWPEPWGCWSVGPQVALNLATPMPRDVVIRLTARAFGPNVGQAFVARVGGEARPFTLGGEMTDVTLSFENPGQASRLTIDVPQPVSARTIGLNDVDDRLLGIGLVRLEVAPARH